MTADPEVYRAAGAVAGAILPLIKFKPLNLRDATARFIFSCVCGYAFYFVALDTFKWPEDPNRIMAGAILAASVSWFIGGALIMSAIKRIPLMDKASPEGD